MSGLHVPRPDALARALDALPPSPLPPAIPRVWEAVARDGRRRARARATLAIAAGALAVVGATFAAFAPRPGPVGDARPGAAAARVVGETSTPDALVVRRAASPVAASGPALRLGDDVEARDAAQLRLDGRTTVDLDPGARLVLRSADEVEQASGRVRYDVEHDAARPFVVTVAGLRIVDVGTRFTVDVFPAPSTSAAAPAGTRRSDAEGGRVLVTVEAGAVRVAGGTLEAGRGRAFLRGEPTGADWPLDARPALRIDVETANPQAGLPVVCRVTLRNPTDAWLPLPTPDGGLPLVVEVVEPDGSTLPVRVTSAMRLAPRPETAIPPRGEAVVRVQFAHTFASPGAYRLRAVYRPADAVDPPRSPEALLTVR